MTKIILKLILLLFPFLGLSQKINLVFQSGQEGHKTYRIPAIIKNKEGHLLAFAEGRVKGASDFGDINIVLKISKNKGKTWSAISTIVDYDSLQAGNPTPILDTLDPLYPQGRIFLFYNTGNNHEGEIRKGKGVREVWYITSTDGGISWSKPINITLQVHRPKQEKFNSKYNFKEDWRHYANGPGHGLLFTSGKYAGRMLVAGNHSESNLSDKGVDYFAHTFYTDDHGKTFHLGETVPLAGSNEATAAQISGDRLMMNMRNQKGDIHARIIGISSTGGEKWDRIYFDKQLPDAICEGSLINMGSKKGKSILAFTNTADTLYRDQLSLKISEDDGLTWKKNILIAKANTIAEAKKDYTAYSDIIQLGRKKIGILYELENYSKIVFREILL
ncbi:MAG: exo-alpha-sialidase [Aquirufa sp.]